MRFSDSIANQIYFIFCKATFGGWLDVAFSAASSRQIDEQPQDDVNPYTFIYFVAFIYFASYVGLKFFTFACIDVVREQRSLRCNGDESFNIRLQRYADEHTLSPVSKVGTSWFGRFMNNSKRHYSIVTISHSRT